MNTFSSSLFKKLFWVIGVALILGMVVIYIFYQKIYAPNVTDQANSNYLYIPTNASFSDVIDSLTTNELIRNQKSFDWVAARMKYNNLVKPGRYKLESGWNNYDLVRTLRLGLQSPVHLTFNSVRTTDELFEKIGTQLELEADQMSNFFYQAETLEKLNLSRHSLLTLFLPNTYQVFWDISLDEFLDRMNQEHKDYWSSTRRKQAAKWNLSPEEVYTLASIVEKESIVDDEKPRIAGVYLNRLQKSIRLQADPTVVFAVGDFGLKRVLYRHLEIDSPFNTYRVDGLPPGPICMPSIKSIEAVLNAEEHDYIFFCAKPEGGGRHAFAKTSAGHSANAKRLHKWLNEKGIR